MYLHTHTASHLHSHMQALTERADVQQSRTARLACIHIAAVSMDYGLAEQGQARAHALQAIQHIREIGNSNS